MIMTEDQLGHLSQLLKNAQAASFQQTKLILVIDLDHVPNLSDRHTWLNITMCDLLRIYQIAVVMARSKSRRGKLSESQLRAYAVAPENARNTRRKLADSLGKSVRWVQKWTQRYKQHGSLADQSHSGRPSALCARAEDLIRKAKGKRDQSCSRLSRRLRNLGEPVSKNNVH